MMSYSRSSIPRANLENSLSRIILPTEPLERTIVSNDLVSVEPHRGVLDILLQEGNCLVGQLDFLDPRTLVYSDRDWNIRLRVSEARATH